MFGEIYTFRLPITGLPVTSSTARFVRASGDTNDLGPVRPDIEIHRTPEDIATNRDPVMERAVHCADLFHGDDRR